MDNQLTPCPEPKKGAESGKSTAGNHFPQANSRVMQSMNSTALTDVILFDELSFPEDECFVLAEEYVLMEGEYVMWEETASCKKKNRKESFRDVFEEQSLFLPEDDSMLHHVGEYFTLGIENRPKKHC